MSPFTDLRLPTGLRLPETLEVESLLADSAQEQQRSFNREVSVRDAADSLGLGFNNLDVPEVRGAAQGLQRFEAGAPGFEFMGDETHPALRREVSDRSLARKTNLRGPFAFAGDEDEIRSRFPPHLSGETRSTILRALKGASPNALGKAFQNPNALRFLQNNRDLLQRARETARAAEANMRRRTPTEGQLHRGQQALQERRRRGESMSDYTKRLVDSGLFAKDDIDSIIEEAKKAPAKKTGRALTRQERIDRRFVREVRKRQEKLERQQKAADFQQRRAQRQVAVRRKLGLPTGEPGALFRTDGRVAQIVNSRTGRVQPMTTDEVREMNRGIISQVKTRAPDGFVHPLAQQQYLTTIRQRMVDIANDAGIRPVEATQMLNRLRMEADAVQPERISPFFLTDDELDEQSFILAERLLKDRDDIEFNRDRKNRGVGFQDPIGPGDVMFARARLQARSQAMADAASGGGFIDDASPQPGGGAQASPSGTTQPASAPPAPAAAPAPQPTAGSAPQPSVAQGFDALDVDDGGVVSTVRNRETGVIYRSEERDGVTYPSANSANEARGLLGMGHSVIANFADPTGQGRWEAGDLIRGRIPEGTADAPTPAPQPTQPTPAPAPAPTAAPPTQAAQAPAPSAAPQPQQAGPTTEQPGRIGMALAPSLQEIMGTVSGAVTQAGQQTPGLLSSGTRGARRRDQGTRVDMSPGGQNALAGVTPEQLASLSQETQRQKTSVEPHTAPVRLPPEMELDLTPPEVQRVEEVFNDPQTTLGLFIDAARGSIGGDASFEVTPEMVKKIMPQDMTPESIKRITKIFNSPEAVELLRTRLPSIGAP